MGSGVPACGTRKSFGPYWLAASGDGVRVTIVTNCHRSGKCCYHEVLSLVREGSIGAIPLTRVALRLLMILGLGPLTGEVSNTPKV